ncbi:MAG: biotin transporter BioY [Firmicutes bacterium]|nr:biotin transporter BioY [Bacillota bacterium]
MQERKTTSKAYSMTSIALMAAVICVVGPFTLPIGPVPITLAPLAILLSVYILGTKKGTIALLIYLLIGAVGVPVFSGFTGGIGKLAGPTGGYLVGYIIFALIAGWFIHRFYNKVVIQFLGMVLALAVLYAFGTAWLAYSAGMTFGAALAVGVLPFIVFDLIKIVITIVLGRAVRSRLLRSGIIS